MSVQITERKIIKLKKPNGSTQYFFTIPKKYAENLIGRNIDTLLVIFNYGLGAFPKEDLAEEALLTFLTKHRDMRAIFSQLARRAEGTSR